MQRRGILVRSVALALAGCGSPSEPDGDDGADATGGSGDGVGTAATGGGATATGATDGGSSGDAGASESGSTGPGVLESWCERGDGSVLATSVAGLQPRQWVELPPNDALAGLEMGYSLLYWNDSGVWDPAAREVAWIGGPGTCCADPAEYKRIVYDVATDVWVLEDTPFVGSGHAYDGNALDPNTGTHYFALFQDQEVKRYDGAGWDALAPIPWSAQPAVGLTWFPELRDSQGALVYVNGFGGVAWFDGAAWNEVTGAEAAPWGSYNLFAEHSPGHGMVWLGAGNGGDTVHYGLDAELNLSRFADAPFSLNNSAALHSVDPISGDFIVANLEDQSWWEFDPVAETWTAIDDMEGTPDFVSGSQFHVPIPACGVILYFDHYWDERHVYLYKHSD